jgi:hypothetical protein
MDPREELRPEVERHPEREERDEPMQSSREEKPPREPEKNEPIYNC